MHLNRLKRSKRLSQTNIITITFRGNDLALIGTTDFLDDLFLHRKDEKVTYFYPKDFFSILNELNTRKIDVYVDFDYNFTISQQMNFNKNFNLYPFQQEAVQSWFDNDNKGILLLPTGSGKTIIALDIISKVRLKTLIVVPTLVLLEQWKHSLMNYLQIEETDIGEFGGGKQDVKDITIITYDSAHLYVKRLRSSFGLLILDEAHHLSGGAYEIIADGYIAPNRLALTATIDENETSYQNLISKGFNKIIYFLKPSQLQEIGVLTNYKVETIKV